jgi:spermidine dehydrogenase
VTKFVEPVIGLISGLSCDAVSARVGHELLIPVSSRPGISFPGGNTTFARHIVKALVPGSMNGDSFETILNGSVDFAALDRLDQPTRMRLGATVLRVEPDSAGVAVTYEKGGKLYRSKARAAVMASAGWMTKHVVTNLPANIRAAYDEFQHASAMSVNVALTNWRFLYKLGAPACRWFSGGFGFSANIRRSMAAGSYQPPLHPDKPVVLTFYTGLYTPGKSPAEQGALGRKKLMETSYRDYERQIRSQMTTMFGGAGFDPVKDIAGIVLNRWGHARIVQPPGFYYGRDGEPAAREIVAKGFGRVAIGHSELDGHQTATGAILQGKRTAESVLGMG